MYCLELNRNAAHGVDNVFVESWEEAETVLAGEGLPAVYARIWNGNAAGFPPVTGLRS